MKIYLRRLRPGDLLRPSVCAVELPADVVEWVMVADALQLAARRDPIPVTLRPLRFRDLLHPYGVYVTRLSVGLALVGGVA